MDYQFYLTPKALNKIRSYNKDNPYGTWNGQTIKKNGIMAYSSNLFRATAVGGEISNVLAEFGDSVKKLGEIGINNQNYVEYGG